MKLSKKTILIGISTLAVVGAGIAYYFITKDKANVLGWMNSSWLYRKAISVANSGSELINEDVLITVDTAALVTAGKIQNNCNDLRFTDSDESTALAYWVEGGCNTSTTQVWVRIPSLTAGGKTIYMYYGNPSAANSEESWTGAFMLLNTTSCPSGWTRKTEYDGKYAYGATSFGTNGGSATHNNGTPSCTTGGPSATAYTQSDSGGATASPSHTHTNAMVSVDNVTNAPPYLNMVYCTSPNLVIDSGMVTLFTSTPSGWTRFSALDNRFAQGAATYGATGGSATHTHTTTGGYTTGGSGTRPDSPGGGNGAGEHTHTTANGVTGSANSIPPYLDMIYASKDVAGSATSGLISMTTSTPPLGWSRYTALDNLFPRGAATQGGTGGAATHTHTVTIVTNPGGGYNSTGSRAISAAASMHTHSCSTTTDSASNIPAYIETLFYQRKASQTASVGTEEVGNLAPNAPTSLLTEGLADPLKISDTTPEFSAVFTDPDASDAGKYYQIQVNTSSDFTGTVMWDTTQTILSPVIANGSRIPDISYAGIDLSTSVTYYWRIKLWDNAAAGSRSSDWSTTAQFAIGVESWANLNYQYRKPLNVTNSQGTTLTNEDVLIQLDTATLISQGKLQVDCDDLRFYDSDDTTSLNYWIEGGCNTSSTQIWVRIPSLPSSGKTIFVYYDNPTAVSNALTWSGAIYMYADAACPAGWTRASALDGKFLYGSTIFGDTGGNNSHSQGDAMCTSSSISTSNLEGSNVGSYIGTTTTHTHTNLKATLLSTSVLPPYTGVITCYSNNFLIHQGLISLFNTSSLLGWTRFNALDNKFPESLAAYGATGGSSTHVHSTTNSYVADTTSNTQALAPSFVATGGTITYTDSNGLNPRSTPPYTGGYTVHKFTSSGTFTVTGSGTVDVLVVAGGGGGGSNYVASGGGGAGGLLYRTGFAVSAGASAVTVGGGGGVDTNGGNSVFSSLTAIGGGNGGTSGSSGGSGAGGPARYLAGGAGTAGQGNNGATSGYSQGGGGGGAGAAAVSGGDNGSPGGNGLAYSISGTSTYYAGGGGGGNGYSGGLGGGGASGVSGTANTGGGGGGGGNYTSGIGTGGSGIVIIRYLTDNTAPGTYASSSHTHTSVSSTVSTESNLPPYIDIVFAKADTDNYVTSSNILMTSSIPPLGWNRFTPLDNKFTRGSTTYGATGGNETHTHNVDISTGGPSITLNGTGAGSYFADSTHTHSCTATSASASNLPPYTTVIYIQRKNSQTINIGDETLQNFGPDAPTSLKIQDLTNPLKVTTFTPYFSAMYTDINTADTANYYQINVNTAADFTGTIMWDSNKTAFGTPIVNGVQSSNINYGGSTLVEGEKYYWRIKFWDENTYQNESEWSATAEFTMQGIPDTPTSLQTNGTVDPLTLTSVPPAFRAIYSDPNHDNATAYQIQVNTNAFFTGTVLWDSTKLTTSITNGDRSPEYWYSGTVMSNSHNTYYWRIRFWDSDNSVSEWSSAAAFTDTYAFSPSTYYEGLKLNGLKLD